MIGLLFEQVAKSGQFHFARLYRLVMTGETQKHRFVSQDKIGFRGVRIVAVCAGLAHGHGIMLDRRGFHDFGDGLVAGQAQFRGD